ncbi:hypothetical protein CAPTEDRAFT_22430, partial [Capitella teleta]
DVHIIGFVPMSGKPWPGGASQMPMVRWAMRDIGLTKSLLPGYRLVLHLADTVGMRSTAVDALYSYLHDPPTKVMAFGPYLSSPTETFAENAALWNITTVSPTASSPALSDLDKYPRFFRFIIPDSMVVPARIAMMRKLNWNKVSLYRDRHSVFSTLINAAILEFDRLNWTVVANEIVTQDVKQQVKSLIQKDARIIFGAFYENTAAEIFCEAYKMGFYGPHVVWFMINWFAPDWMFNDRTVSCTPEQLLEATSTSFYDGMLFVNPSSTPSASGKSGEDLEKEYSDLFNGSLPYGDYHRLQTYDSILAIAMALNETNTRLILNGKLIEDFEYSDIEMADLLTESMRTLNFAGVNGHVAFDSSGSLMPEIVIEQQQGRKRTSIAGYDFQSDSVNWVNGGPRWPGGKVPSDSSIIVYQQQYIDRSLYATMCFIAVLGIIETIGLLVFNMYHRHKRVIKMSSPNINNVALFGCALCYTTVFFADTADSAIDAVSTCTIRMCSFIVGFSIVFGALFSKTWRVHCILTSTKKLKQNNVIRDSKLMLMILVIVTVNVLIILVWQLVDPYKIELVNQESMAKITDDVKTIPQLVVCSSPNGLYFTAVLYCVQGLLMAFGVFLAWETRKVKLEALNDSKLIGLAIYNVLVLSVVGAVINYAIDDDMNLLYGITSGIMTAGTMLTSNIIFVPKV